jgi:hypothetical protein
VIVSPKDTIPTDISQAGWIAYNDLVPGMDVLPEDFKDEKSEETAFIYYSSGKRYPLSSAIVVDGHGKARRVSAKVWSCHTSTLHPSWSSVGLPGQHMSMAATSSWV